MTGEENFAPMIGNCLYNCQRAMISIMFRHLEMLSRPGDSFKFLSAVHRSGGWWEASWDYLTCAEWLFLSTVYMSHAV